MHLERLVKRHVISASQNSPSLKGRTIAPHTLRHSAAMALLRRGVDLTVIALWLGHESTETTMIYLHADMQLKERALKHASATNTIPERFQPPDGLLAFLERL
jgi:integrase/recombinase XerD